MSNALEPGQRGSNALNARSEPTPLHVVEDIAERYFGIRGDASTLSSERDETFLVAADDRRYVLKIANPAERMEVLEFQTQGLMHLAGKRLSVPLPLVVAAPDGRALLTLPFGRKRRIVRMLTFLDGLQLYKAPASAAQMQSIGHALALLGQGLSDFRPKVPKQDLLWDICNAAALRELVDEIEPAHRDLVVAALDDFDVIAHGPISDLRRQVIHNDFNPHNVLVADEDPTAVTGVIDFGDMVEAPLVNDIAVALSYQVGSPGGLGQAASMLRAYHQVRPLQRLELALLPTLLRTRLAMTVTITEWRARLHPQNSTYILRNHPIALAGLKLLAENTDPDLAAFFQTELEI